MAQASRVEELVRRVADEYDALSKQLKTIAQYVTESESAQMLPEDREYMNELVVVHVLDNSFTVRRSLAQMLFRALNNYEAESQGEE